MRPPSLGPKKAPLIWDASFNSYSWILIGPPVGPSRAPPLSETGKKSHAGMVGLFVHEVDDVLPLKACLLEKKAPADMVGLVFHENHDLFTFLAWLLETKSPCGHGRICFL